MDEWTVVSRKHFVFDNRVSWTADQIPLATRAAHALTAAENMFGPRDSSYTFGGVEFTHDGPHTFFPMWVSPKAIVIHLSLECLTEYDRACYQLAHECVHLLSPSGAGGNPALVIEEGAATHFQEWYMQTHLGRYGWHSTLPSYTAARDAVRELLAIDGNAIKKLRERDISMRNISGDLILQVCPTIDPESAAVLARPFIRE